MAGRLTIIPVRLEMKNMTTCGTADSTGMRSRPSRISNTCCASDAEKFFGSPGAKNPAINSSDSTFLHLAEFPGEFQFRHRRSEPPPAHQDSAIVGRIQEVSTQALQFDCGAWRHARIELQRLVAAPAICEEFSIGCFTNA